MTEVFTAAIFVVSQDSLGIEFSQGLFTTLQTKFQNLGVSSNNKSLDSHLEKSLPPSDLGACFLVPAYKRLILDGKDLLILFPFIYEGVIPSWEPAETRFVDSVKFQDPNQTIDSYAFI